MTQATYDRLWDVASGMLKAGFSVVVDATFLSFSQRQPFIRLAHEGQFSFVILDVWAPEEILAQRIERRAKQRTDASDATIGVMERQKAIDEPLTEAERSHVIRMDSTDLKSVQATMRGFIERRETREN